MPQIEQPAPITTPPVSFGPATAEPTAQPLWIRGLTVAVIYYGLAMLSLMLTDNPEMEASYWLPSGIILGTLLLTERREWGVMVLVMYGADLVFNFTGSPWTLGDWFMAMTGNIASGLVGAWLVQRFVTQRIQLANVRELVGVTALGGGAGLVVTAVVGAWIVRKLGGGASYLDVWKSWYFSDLLGILLMTPLMLAWRGVRVKNLGDAWSERRAEAAAMMMGVCICVVVAVWYDWLQGPSSRFVVLPFVMWAALRFGTRGVTVVSLVVALLVGWFTLRGFGGNLPGAATPHERNVELQLGLALVAFFGLIPAIVIEAHRRAEAEVRGQRNFHQAIFDAEPESVKVIGLDGGILQINRAGLAVLEVAELEEARDHGILNFVHPDFRERFSALQLRVLAGESGKLLFQLRGKKGALRWLEVHATALRDGEGRISGMLAVSRDVTESKQTGEALQLARFTVDRATLALLWVTREAGVADANAAACALLGYSRDELLRLRLPDIDPEFSAARWPRHWEELRREHSLTFPSQQRKKDGSLIDVTISTHYLQFGETELSCAFVQDITEQKRAEDARRESEERLKLIFSAVTGGIVVLDRNLKVIQTNAAAGRILGLPENYLLGRTADERRAREMREDSSLFAPDEIPSAVALRTGRPVRDVIMGVHRPDGGIAWICVNVEPLRDPQGDVTMLVTSFSDITASRALQEQVRQAQKMEVVGQLAGGVAHDFNNILTAMMLNLQIIETDECLPGELRAPLEDLRGMTRRAAKLTEQLLLFARRRAMQTQPLELNASITQVLTLLRRLLGEHIAVNLRLAPAALWISADAGMLDQVVMNLCVNARDAMPTGGTLLIETTLVQLHAPTAHPAARPGSFARLSVGDTGCGMGSEVLAHLFEPFFTTKEVGKGTGLGLATVHGIVQQHLGWVEVETEVGRGSTFVVYIPITVSSRTAPIESLRMELGGGTETILLVEDEESVRLVASTLLRRLGYRVLEAGNGPEALEVWAQHGPEIALLITDMVMPEGLTGIDLGEKLQQAKPGLGVILMSGYNEEILRGEAGRTAAVSMVAKPFEFAAFAEMVRQKLGPVSATASATRAV